MSRSWFYLTLWRGTPPEFTTEFNTQIEDTSSASVFIRTADGVESSIDTMASLSANVRSREVIDTDIIKTTEVVWYVS